MVVQLGSLLLFSSHVTFLLWLYHCWNYLFALRSQPETLVLIEVLLDIQNTITTVPTDGFGQIINTTTNSSSTTVATSPLGITCSSISNL